MKPALVRLHARYEWPVAVYKKKGSPSWTAWKVDVPCLLFLRADLVAVNAIRTMTAETPIVHPITYLLENMPSFGATAVPRVRVGTIA